MSLTTTSFIFPIDFPQSKRTGRMHFCHGLLDDEGKLPSMLLNDFYGLIFNLSQNVWYDINGDQSGFLPKRHYCLVYCPSGNWEVTIEKGIHSWLIIEFTPPHIEMMESGFPIAATFRNNAKSENAPIFSEPYPIIPSIFDEIRTMPFDDKSLVNQVLQGCKYITISMDSLRQMELIDTLTSEEIEKIRQAHTFMMSNLKHPITVPFLADMVGLTKHNFQRGFKHLYGTSVYHYLTDVRMTRAIALVRDTNMNLSEIATEVGYKKLNTFHKLFKRWFGRAPGELRKNADENH